MSEGLEAGLLQTYLESVFTVHSQYPFAQGLKVDMEKKAKMFLDQRLLDRRAELCSSKLQLEQSLQGLGGTLCTRAADFLGPYMQKAAAAYDSNRAGIQALHEESIALLKKKLFEIASGSTVGLEGVSYQGQPLLTAPRELKIAWLKEVASQLGTETHKAWGLVDGDKNPLLQLNTDFAREALEAKKDSESARKSGVPCK
jgi:hypothetical protein